MLPGAGNGSGMTALTFGFANGSIVVADDVAVPAGTGLVGELVTHADVNMPSPQMTLHLEQTMVQV